MCDGAYDKESIWNYEDIGKMEIIILPRKDAKEEHNSEARNRTVEKINESGREKWKYKKEYCKR